jgi:predicted RNA-binding protein YlqC (UPF0109 family)
MSSPLSVVRTDNNKCSMKELVEVIARALVDQPDAVSVSEISGVHSSIVELTVAKEDMGKIIGKQGRIADAMRIIVNAVSAKLKQRSVLTVIE